MLILRFEGKMDSMDLDVSGCFEDSFVTQTENSKAGKIFNEFMNIVQEIEKSSEDTLKDQWAETILSAPETAAKILNENSFHRDLSYCLQIICNGTLHVQNREEIYGDRLEVFQQFLKQLLEACVKPLDNIVKWCSNNTSIIQDLNIETSDEVIELSVEIIIALSRLGSSGTRSASKLLIVLLRAVKSISNSSHLITRFADEMQDLIQAEKYNVANYFGKILSAFTREIFKKQMDVADVLQEVINIFLTLERLDENLLPFKGPFLRLLLLTKKIVQPICKCDSENSNKINFVVTVMNTLKLISPQSRGDQSSEIIKHLLQLLFGADMSTLTEIIDNKVLPSVCQLIRTMDNAEFDELQEILLINVINSDNFEMTLFITDLYSFICQIAPKPVVKECLDIFTREDMPLKVKCFVLPAIARTVNWTSLNTNSDFICRFELINCKARSDDLSNEDLAFIETFWKGIRQQSFSDNSEWNTLIAICLRMRYIAKKLDDRLTAVILQSVFDILTSTTNSQCVALTILSVMKYVPVKSEQIAFKIVNLYVLGNSDHSIISLLKNHLENIDQEIKLEDYENSSNVISSIEKSVNSMQAVIGENDKQRIKNIISILQNFL